MAERLWFSLPSTAQMPSECKSFNCGIIIYRHFFYFFIFFYGITFVILITAFQTRIMPYMFL